MTYKTTSVCPLNIPADIRPFKRGRLSYIGEQLAHRSHTEPELNWLCTAKSEKKTAFDSHNITAAAASSAPSTLLWCQAQRQNASLSQVFASLLLFFWPGLMGIAMSFVSKS